MSEKANETLYPGAATVYIEARFGSNWISGSGAIVGRNDVLTAAHVIYDPGSKASADEIRVYAGYDPTSSYRYYSPSYWSYYSDFDPDADGFLYHGDGITGSMKGSELDIAVLSFKEPIADYYGSYGLKSDFRSGAVNVLGYPGKYGNYLIYDSGSGQQDDIDNVIDFGDDVEINSGNSGGPVYVTENGSPYVVGVVSTGGWATSLKNHYDWLLRIRSLNDPLTGLSGATWHEVDSSSQSLSGSSTRLDIFDMNVNSKWRNTSPITTIYGYDKNDYIQFDHQYSKDLITVDYRSAGSGALDGGILNLIGLASPDGSVYGVEPVNKYTTQYSRYRAKKGTGRWVWRTRVEQIPTAEYQNWLNSGSPVFDPYEVATVVNADNTTWLLVNDGIQGYDLNSDVLLAIGSYVPTVNNPIHIL